MILHAVRWPIILRAVLSAVFRIKKPYMITPKGSYSKIVPTAKLYQPFVLLGIINALAIIAASLVHGDETLEAQSVFALTNALFMAIICLVDLGILLRKGQVGLNQIDIAWIKPVGCTATLLAIIAIAILYLPAVSVARAAAIDSFYHQEVDGNPQDKSPQTILELTKSIPATHTVPTLGLYSPNNNTLRQPHIEHIFIDWRDNDLLIQKQYEVLKSRNTLLVTIEPRGEEDGAKLLSDIESGAYDERLDELSTTLGASGRPVYVRFAHEMELANLYPWGNQDPDQFKRSFRYVVDYFREHQAENVKWVWSPAGNDGSELYYPGDDVVDVVGVTVLYDQYFYGQLQPSFSELVQLRSSLAVLGKPMWVVEFGVGSADPEYQAELLETAIAQYQSLGYESLIYLDIADSNIDGPDYRLRNQSALRAALAPPQREPVPAATTPSKSLLTTFCPGPAFQTMLTQNKTPRLNDC